MSRVDRAVVSYDVLCSCGQSLRGARQRRHQVVPCPGCGRGVFVLPESPLETGEAAPAAPVSARPWWHAPLLAGGPWLGALLGGVVRPPPPPTRPGGNRRTPPP